ncbi:MAG: hypothetical protein AAF206_09350 [Bacteroidota bacterium]
MFREHTAYLVGALVAICSFWLFRPGAVYTYQVELDLKQQADDFRDVGSHKIRKAISRSLAAARFLSATEGSGFNRNNIRYKSNRRKLAICFSDRNPQKALFVVNALCREMQRDESIVMTDNFHAQLSRRHAPLDYIKWILMVVLAGFMVGKQFDAPTRSFPYSSIHLQIIEVSSSSG